MVLVCISLISSVEHHFMCLPSIYLFFFGEITKSCHFVVVWSTKNIDWNISQIYLDSNSKEEIVIALLTGSKNWKFLSTSSSMTYPRQVWTGLYSLVPGCAARYNKSLPHQDAMKNSFYLLQVLYDFCVYIGVEQHSY